MRTLISHEWLAPHGGSENVFEALARALPGSDLQCLWNDAPQRFNGVAETWLARTPLRRSKAAALPLMPLAWDSVDLKPYDRVVASSHAFGHQLASRAADSGKQAYAYIHTPARYVWFPESDDRGRGVVRQTAARMLQRQDRRKASAEVDYAANSEFVRDRIRRVWDVDATVIPPPVRVDLIQSVEDWSTKVSGMEADLLAGLPDAFVLGASRLIDYKRLDLTMRTGEALGLPVVIAGSGPSESALRALADTLSVPVTFAGRVSDELLFTLYQRASLFVFMAVEDFGIMPVEAMAAGTPVLLNTVGGAAETVRGLDAGLTMGIEASPSQAAAVARAALTVDSLLLTSQAQRFSEARFASAINDWISAPSDARRM